MSDPDRKCAAVAAAGCAEAVLPLFEAERPGDHRPRDAIAAARAWAPGEASVTEARRSAFSAHAAAREAAGDAAVAAARAAGHAAATAHVAGHGPHATRYAEKARLAAR